MPHGVSSRPTSCILIIQSRPGKHFSNSEIRSRTKPKVFGQIRRYEEALRNHQTEVLKFYDQVLNNLRDLKISSNHEILESLKIDFLPRLIVFEVDKDKKDDKHLQKLRSHFGSRLILKYK